MRNVTSYSTGALLSIIIHVGVLAALVINWESDSKKVIIQPQYIEAKLVQLAPKKTPVVKKPAKPKVDRAKKKREQDKRRADQKKRADKNKAEAKRLAELEAKLKAKQEAKRKADQVEAERQRIESEFAETLAQEQADISAQEDQQVANSFVQLIRQRLSQNWSRPPSARRDMETMIEIRLVPTGRIVGVNVVKSSGDLAFDRSVEQAAFKAEQFEEIKQLDPRLFEKYFRVVKVAFSPEDLRL